MDRAEMVHQAFLGRVAAGDLPPGRPPAGPLEAGPARAAFRAGVASRALDLVAREMQRRGEGFYTIGSSGHEGMAAVAMALRPDDMALLHYRDAAFQIARAGQLAGQDPVWDLLLSFAASAEDPISGGRHKVLGSRALMIPPQTSTIASHLPKAVGAAYSIGAARRHRPEHAILAPDGVVMASFGDASVNHAAAQAAFNAAGWAVWQGAPLPLLMICEDNGIGISTRSPRGWVEAVLRSRPGLTYFQADGLDLYDTFRVASEAARHVRDRQAPAVLHLRMVRLYGHAGADLPETYLTRDEIAADEANDPLLHAVRLLAEAGVMDRAEALALYCATLDSVRARAVQAATRPRLATAAEVMASIVPPSRQNRPSPPARTAATTPATEAPQPMVRQINRALADLMQAYPEITLMGEDVGAKGGVYGATQKLQARFGAGRVIDTLLDETSILGLALGMAQNGFVPLPEIQFLAYLHNAEDQLRGEAATLAFFSNGQFSNPMVVRIAGLGYQKGFGGHFHNDNALGVLRDIPGLILACPSNGADAAMMLREAVRLAREEQRVVVMLEPIAIYPLRDLHAPGDSGCLTAYPDPALRIALGEVGVTGAGGDLAIVSYGNGHLLALRAARMLERDGVGVRVIDLRWLQPLPEAALVRALEGVGRVLIVDECRRSGNLSEGLMAWAVEAGHSRVARLTAEDSFIATGPAYAVTLPSLEGVLQAARRMLADGPGSREDNA
jgi:2-oxoisovalerate dehydrogenase E1 component